MKKAITFLILIALLCFCLTGCKSDTYKQALALQEAGDYTAALELYETLDGYKESSIRIEECNTMIAEIEAYNAAKDLFDAAQVKLGQKNNELEQSISSAEAIIQNGQTALDSAVIPALETAITESRAAKMEIPSIPEETDAILAIIPELEAVDYADVLNNLSAVQKAAEVSIAQYALVNAPEEAYIVECLGKVAGITGISAATEDNDPNGQLHKAGGYTAQVYFSYELVNQGSVYGSTIIEKGTDGGGSIEVYSCVEDAEKRDAYLASYDGTIFATGSHKVIGTVIVRTSHKLTASQQKALEANIIDILIAIEE